VIHDGVRPAEAAQVMTARVEPEVSVRPLPDSEVRRARDKERAAPAFDQLVQKLPIRVGRDGEPLYLDVEFLEGTGGAQANISGVSGVAAKTTYATFLLSSLFGSVAFAAEAVNTKALILNVKEEDRLSGGLQEC